VEKKMECNIFGTLPAFERRRPISETETIKNFIFKRLDKGKGKVVPVL
jgi:hypothetical protein